MSGIIVTGPARCFNDGRWSMNIDGGSGSVGGMPLAADDFGGSLASTGGEISGRVKVDLPRHVAVVPAWQQTATLTLSPAGRAWSGTVDILAKGSRASRMRMTGPLASDGSYRLAVRGSIGIAEVSWPLSGWLASGAHSPTGSDPGSPRFAVQRPTWLITGSASRNVRIPGATLLTPSVRMTQAHPGVIGLATVQVAAPSPVRVDTALTIVNENTWVASAQGSSTNSFRVPGASFARADTSHMAGSITSQRGKVTWHLTAPMTMNDDGLTLSGSLVFEGAARWRLQVTRATGTILGRPGGAITHVGGSVVIDGQQAAGTLVVQASDTPLVSLPGSGWRYASELHLVLKENSSGGWQVARWIDYSMTRKASLLHFRGWVPSSGPFRLLGGGGLGIAGQRVPFLGAYESTGWVNNGVPRTEPYWTMTGDMANAAGGGVRLSGGAKIARGQIGFPGHGAPESSVARSLVIQDESTTEVSGSVEVTLDSGSTFYLNCILEYVDDDNWTLTADGDSGDIWTPYTGLSIPDFAFHGSVVTVDGVQTWGVTTDEIEWTGMATGADMTSSFSISDECTLETDCPDAEGIFVSTTSAPLETSGNPGVTVAGAFLSDGSWARWDGTSPDLSYNGITMASPHLVVWEGDRSDPPPGLDMPQLSDGSGNGFNFQFCGNFTVAVPDVATANSSGCIEWSNDGVVMAQASTGGDVDGGAYNGVTIGDTTLTGYAWTTLPDEPTVGINGVELILDEGRDYLTATMDIPANVNHDVGAGDAASTITATGWFTDAGDFSLDADIPVNMTSSGFTLDSISVHIGKDGSSFALQLGANAEVSVSGHHYPAGAYVGFEHDGDTSITVRLTVSGAVSDESQGGFDTPTLLPTGDFEPVNTTLVDGSFDGKSPVSQFQDGGFENSPQGSNLLQDPDLELGADSDYMVNGDFEDGTYGNVLANADAEDSDLLNNGEFERSGVPWAGWGNTTNFSLESYASSAPTNPVGNYVALVKNNSGATGSTTSGTYQNVWVAPVAGAAYTFTAWMLSATGGSTNVTMSVRQNCSTASVTSKSVSVSSTAWLQTSMSVTGLSGCTSFTVFLSPKDTSGKAYFDGATLTLDSSPSPSIKSSPTTPAVRARMDSFGQAELANYASDVYITSDSGNAVLRSDGCSSYWYPAANGWGYTGEDFDFSMRVKLVGGSSDREVADIAFWMNGSGTAAKGYAFAIQSSKTNAGFWQMNGNGNFSRVSGSPDWGPVSKDVWYEVRLTSVGGVVTGVVTDTTTNTVFYQVTMTMPAASSSYPHSGVIGQAADVNCSSQGSYWDDVTVYSPQSYGGTKYDSSGAHSGTGYVTLPPQNYSSTMALYPTGLAPEQGKTYAYSAWVRASATAYPNLVLDTVGGTFEQVKVPITATTTWTKFSGAITIANSGHTDLRVGLTDMASGIELRLDDQMVQEVPWLASPTNPLKSSTYTTTTDKHGGSQSMGFVDFSGSGATAQYKLAKPISGVTYTLSAWVKSSAGVSGTLRLADDGGSSSTTVNASGSWVQYTVTRKSTGGSGPLATAFDIKSGFASKEVLIDDVTLTATANTSATTASDGTSSYVGSLPLTGWSNAGNYVFARNDAANAHGGSAYLAIVHAGGSQQSQASVTTSPRVGGTYTGSAWVRSNAGAAGKLWVGTNLEWSSPVSFTGTGTWQQVSVDLPIRASGATTMYLKVENSSTTGQELWLDDVALALKGLGTVDPLLSAWSPSDKYTSLTVIDSPGNAHGGTNYAQMQTTATTGIVYLDGAVSLQPGTQRYGSAWVRSPTGAQVSGSIRFTAFGSSDSANNEQRWADFTLNDNQWHRVYVTLPVTKSGNTTLRPEIDIYTANVPLDFDDLESCDLSTWSLVQPSGVTVNEARISDKGSAAEGPAYLTFTSSGASGGVGATVTKDLSGKALSITSGSVYTMSTYVRSTTGADVTGHLSLALGTATLTAPFTANGEWQQVSVATTATSSATSLLAQVLLDSGGQLDVDSIVVAPRLIAQDDPWTTQSSGPSVTWGVYDDPSRAHDGSYGVLEISKSGSGDAGVRHAMDEKPAVGATYSATAFVRSSTGAAVTGTVKLVADGGTVETATASFTAGTDWTPISLRLPIKNGNHTGMHVEVLLTTAGIVLDVDDVVVQKIAWQVTSDPGGTATQTIIADGGDAESGSGFLRVVNSGSASGGTYLDTSGPYAVGSTTQVKAYVRSATGDPVNGSLQVVSTTGGTAATTSFTAGADWTAVTVQYTVTGSDAPSLRTTLLSLVPGAALDIDTVTVGAAGPAPDGVSTPLPHPEHGYAYLWDDAFDIPGAHLWSMTAQIEFVQGRPGLGVGATMYQDPSKAAGVMVGTDWIKGDMALNISEYDPCFSFAFDSSGGDSKISIDNGLFTSDLFQINFAPRGCTIGAYVVPRGASVQFDADLGDSTLDFALEVGRDDNGDPYFYEELGVYNLDFGGITYKTMLLTVDISAEASDVTFVGDFVLPSGLFYGDFTLDVDNGKIHKKGTASLTDWSMAGGGFDVTQMSFSIDMYVDFGSDQCGFFDSSTSGQMSMAQKTNLAFTGELRIDCGRLSILHFQYNYTHKGTSSIFALDYNSSKHTLAGGAYFSFERKITWRFFGIKFQRHPKIDIGLTFSMDTQKPSSAYAATLGGKIKVSGGSGSMSCTINSTGDDSCHFKVDISAGGGKHWEDDW